MKSKSLIIFILGVVFLLAAAPVKAWWLMDQFGQLVEFGLSGQVLGEGSGKEGGGEIRKEEQKREEFKTEKPSEENRIKMEIKPGEVKTEIREGEMRIKLERKDGQVRMKFKNEATGEERELEIRKEEEMRLREKLELAEPEVEEPEMELPEDEREIEGEIEQELLRIREREDRNEIRVGSDGGRFVIKRNRIGAESDFPLSIDLSTNTLSVTTPAGERQVTVLPDQAVQNMLGRNVIDEIVGQGELSGKVRMSQKSDGTLVYEVEGEKQERLFGLVPRKFKKTAVVSAETGELIETKQAFTDRILELFSF